MVETRAYAQTYTHIYIYIHTPYTIYLYDYRCRYVKLTILKSPSNLAIQGRRQDCVARFTTRDCVARFSTRDCVARFTTRVCVARFTTRDCVARFSSRYFIICQHREHWVVYWVRFQTIGHNIRIWSRLDTWLRNKSYNSLGPSRYTTFYKNK